MVQILLVIIPGLQPYAPVEDPQIAIVALIINQDKWKIKATYLGEQALEQFFSMKRRLWGSLRRGLWSLEK